MNRSIRESGLLAIGAFTACVALSVFASTRVKPTYTADAKLLFTKEDTTSAFTDFAGGGGDRLESLLNDQTPLTTQMQVIQARPILQETVEILGLQDEEGELLTADSLRDGLEVGIVSGTDVLEINYVSEDPDTSAAVVNTIIDRYREYSITQNRAEASEAKEFLLAQLPQSELAVRQAETELRDFLEQNNIGVLEDEAISLVNQIERLAGEAATVQSTLEGTRAQANALQSKLGLTADQAFLVGTIRQNPGVQEALLDLQEVEREMAAEGAQFKPNSPVMRQLQSRKDSLEGFLREQIAQAGGGSRFSLSAIQGAGAAGDDIAQVLIQDFVNTEVSYIGLEQQLATLRNAQATYQQRLSSIPSLSAQKRALERRVAVAEDTYSALLTRVQELQVQENEATYNTRIIEPATPPLTPDGGSKKKYLAVGVFAGAVVALAIVIGSQVLSSPLVKPSKQRELAKTQH
ncbi:GumC family protein [Leptolyngbya iicbica]|nr:GumC family protein [Leptolyngbya sp. LK]